MYCGAMQVDDLEFSNFCDATVESLEIRVRQSPCLISRNVLEGELVVPAYGGQKFLVPLVSRVGLKVHHSDAKMGVVVAVVVKRSGKFLGNRPDSKNVSKPKLGRA